MEYERNDVSAKTLYPFTKTGSDPDIDCPAKWYSGYIINCIFITCDKYIYENSSISGWHFKYVLLALTTIHHHYHILASKKKY